MPCDVCGHTIQRVEGRWFWCPRCGTMHEISSSGDYRHHEAPALVSRVKEAQNDGCFQIDSATVRMLHFVWNNIAESVGLERIT